MSETPMSANEILQFLKPVHVRYCPPESDGHAVIVRKMPRNFQVEIHDLHSGKLDSAVGHVSFFELSEAIEYADRCAGDAEGEASDV